MNTSCSTRTIRYLMFSFNLLFVITGIILIAVGASIHSKYSDYNVFLDGKYFSLPNLLIATGALIFFISFLGCYGAFKESWLMLMAFSILLGVIFVFEFSAGIAGYVLRDKTISYLENKFKSSLPFYTNSSEISSMWDHIQQEFTCCGVNNPGDWTNQLKQGNDLPISCCPMVNGIIGTFRCNNDVVSPTVSTSTVPADTKDGSSQTEPTTTPSTTVTESPATDTTTPASTTGETEIPSSTTDDTTSSDTQTASVTAVNETTTTDKVTESDGTNIARSRLALVALSSSRSTDDSSSSQPYTVGCRDAFGDWVKTHAVHIGVVGFIFAIIQVAGIGFACHLSRQLKNRYYST